MDFYMVFRNDVISKSIYNRIWVEDNWIGGGFIDCLLMY